MKSKNTCPSSNLTNRLQWKNTKIGDDCNSDDDQYSDALADYNSDDDQFSDALADYNSDDDQYSDALADYNSDDDQYFDPLDDTDADDYQFLDALDEFRLFDRVDDARSGEFLDLSTVSGIESVEGGAEEVVKATHSSENLSQHDLRRRSSFRNGRQGISGEDSNCNSPGISVISQAYEATTLKERRNKIYSALKEKEKVFERSDSSPFRLSSDRIGIVNEQNLENTTINSAENEHDDDSEVADSPSGDRDASSSNFLVFLAQLVIKAIGLQIRLMVSFFTFPVWLLYYSFMFVMNPFQYVRRCREYLMEKLLRIWGVFCERVTRFINEQFKVQKSIGKLAIRFGWGFFWSVYVCFMLVGLLLVAFIMGGFILRFVVEEPIEIIETLNFDYTKPSPVALIPIISCHSVSCGVRCKENVEVGKHVGSRVIPPNRKLQVTISLTLPESEYNRKLGIFQVRVDLLSAYGIVTASSRYPCMLRFTSQPIHFVETFLKTPPLVVGYSSESQMLNLKMRGLTEGNEPTACIKVVLEQRAEYRSGAGIPEIYAASMVLVSELPLFKRIIWNWKITLFIWISMMSFIMELMFVLVCCGPIIIPRIRPRDGSANNSSPQNTAAQLEGS
ncbi:hypothetical protein HHK36_005193 [Tetracentron sinense]|uniref:Seipin n=1 Tax=Tetracentron sinense TaxID=13715 RepID=A0A834ZP11_TETSI|nr:hypothetical protein HHK36_005193 [Tetracentron sinense]